MSYFVNLAKANADNARLSAELAALIGERDKLTLAIAERDAAAESVRAQFDATIADLTEKLSVSTKEVATLQAAAQTAGQQAANIVAAQGIPAGQTPAGEPVAAVTGADLIAGLNACKSPLERAKFIKANQQALAKLTRN